MHKKDYVKKLGFFDIAMILFLTFFKFFNYGVIYFFIVSLFLNFWLVSNFDKPHKDKNYIINFTSNFLAFLGIILFMFNVFYFLFLFFA
jgi:hypothetical protein